MNIIQKTLLLIKQKFILLTIISKQYILKLDKLITESPSTWSLIIIISTLSVMLIMTIVIMLVIKNIIAYNNEYIIAKLNHYTAVFDKQNIGEIGAWGEEKLTSLLVTSGLSEGINFHRNKSFYVDDKQLRPDFVILLTSDISLIIDVKTPWLSYKKYLESTSHSEKQRALREHAGILKKHIKDLASKDYKRIDTSLPFVLVFIPIESMYTDACKHEYEIKKTCRDNNIFVVTPQSLYSILMIVGTMIANSNFSNAIIKHKHNLDTMINNFDVLINNLDNAVHSLNKKSREISILKDQINFNFANKLKNIRDLDNDVKK